MSHALKSFGGGGTGYGGYGVDLPFAIAFLRQRSGKKGHSRHVSFLLCTSRMSKRMYFGFTASEDVVACCGEEKVSRRTMTK